MEYNENDKIVVVWEVTCLKPTGDRRAKFLVIDTGDDPNFQCEGCGVEGNHLPPELPVEIDKWTDMQAERVKRWNHYMILVGRVYLKDLKELALKDKRGWYR